MKRIQKSRSTGLLTLAFLLLAIILLSAIAGTVLWAKPDNPNKPNKPEKPEEPFPHFVEADFKIWIGNGNLGSPEDIVLQPYGDPEMDYLFVEDYTDYYGDFWIPTNSKAPGGDWSITLGRVNEGDTAAPYCGTYNINDQSLLDALNLQGDFDIDNQDLWMFYIGHITKTLLNEDDRKPVDADFWWIQIVWETDSTVEIPNPGGEPDPLIFQHQYILEGKTNRDLEPEGVYDENTDTWTITFDIVFELKENISAWPVKFWEGPLSFTVEIQRILP